MKDITNSKLIVITSIFFLAFGNITFFANVLGVYAADMENALFLLSLVVVFVCINVVLLSLVCFRHTIKPVLIALLLISSQSAYFMDTYHVVIDSSMLDNIIKTDVNEAADLISIKQMIYLLLLGLAPALLIYRLDIRASNSRFPAVENLKLLALSLAVLIITLLVFGNYYASFFREHKQLRFYSNPSYYLYSAGKYIKSISRGETVQLQPVGQDARVPASDQHRELVILVVGETARADHFSLNGYDKKTNPHLEEKGVISFTDVWACGTSTALSVPCMFSIYSQGDYSDEKAQSTENVLDVLKHSGVNVLWLDNNSDSKGVATRVPYESYKNPDKNPVCDTECRDEGMLVNLQAYIDNHPDGDIFVVLHQMGNHGPAYYKRYPKRFEKFTPVCKTNQLEQCRTEEISNAYDNAILYTDYFLSQTIELLAGNSAANNFEAAMIYVSDHGESLGENNLYLHGLPYMFAPDTQKHVPLVMWFSESMVKDEVDVELIKSKVNAHYTHDNVFHTILGLLEIDTSVYDRGLDMIAHDKEYDDQLVHYQQTK